MWQAQGTTGQYSAESVFHDALAASQYGALLTLASGHIDHLQGTHVLTRSALSTVMAEVGLEMPGLLDIPWQTSHKDVARQLVASWSRAGQTRPVPFYDLQATPHTGDANSSQRLQQRRRGPQLTVSIQMLSHPYQVWGHTLNTDVVKTLIDRLLGVVYVTPIRPLSLFPPICSSSHTAPSSYFFA